MRDSGQNSYALYRLFQYSGGWRAGEKGILQAAFAGNSLKSMKLSLEASLRKLRTKYVDIFYLHWFDRTTSNEEIMDGLHNLVAAGSVLYLVCRGGRDTKGHKS